jgi:hypothetical protein
MQVKPFGSCAKLWRGKMNILTRALAILVLFGSVGLVGVRAADATYLVWGHGYTIYCSTTAQYNLALQMVRYEDYARAAALLSVGGRNLYKNDITVSFVNQNKKWDGITTGTGYTYSIQLNLHYTHTPAYWGGVLAHETSHVYFN